MQTSPTTALTDAGEVLRLVGLTLPTDATEVVVEPRELASSTQTANYVVRFTASATSVREFAAEYSRAETYPGTVSESGGLEDWSEYDGVRERSFDDVGLTTAPAGSRFAAHSVHTSVGQGNLSVLVEGPDLTRVNVGFWLATR